MGSVSKLQKKYLITKSNTLNEFRPRGMTLQELRFFTIYLSKINPKDEKTKLVRFPVADFQAIMDFDRVDIKKLKGVIDGLLTKVTGERLPSGGFIRYLFFKECRVDKDENNEWFIEIEASDRALPMMFNLKNHYFKYQLWNTLRLKSMNQLRMYEILKQHEKIGHRVVSVEILKDLLGIESQEYSNFAEFKRRVLNVCQEALAEHTDISYTYEPHGKKGRGGKVLELKFIIAKNKGYIDPLYLDKFIDLNTDTAIDGDYKESILNDLDENGNLYSTGTSPIYEERISFLMDACNNEFSRKEIIVLFDKMPDWAKHDENDSHDYLQSKYREMDMRNPDKSRFGYLKSIIGKGE